MRSDPPRRFLPAAPVTCVACGADAFAVGQTREVGDAPGLELDLRCGACGRWQRHRLSEAVTDRFLDHLAATQQTIARALARALRAGIDL